MNGDRKVEKIDVVKLQTDLARNSRTGGGVCMYECRGKGVRGKERVERAKSI